MSTNITPDYTRPVTAAQARCLVSMIEFGIEYTNISTHLYTGAMTVEYVRTQPGKGAVRETVAIVDTHGTVTYGSPKLMEALFGPGQPA